MSMVDISGLDKADVLAALYNKARPIGYGILNARLGDMTREQAQQLIEGEAWTDDVIDYECVYPLLDVERNRSLDYLQSALQVNE